MFNFTCDENHIKLNIILIILVLNKPNQTEIFRFDSVYFHFGVASSWFGAEVGLPKRSSRTELTKLSPKAAYIVVQSFTRPRIIEPLYTKLSLYILKEKKKAK